MHNIVPTLILTPRNLRDTQQLEETAWIMGWNVLRLTGWRVPTNLHPQHPVVYGEPLFAEVVAAALDLALIQTPPAWLANLPARWLSRLVQLTTFAEARLLPGAIFAKPADEKSFPAKVYPDGQAIPLADVLAADSPVLVSEPVRWEVEYRCVVVERTVRTLSPYWRDGVSAQADDGSWPASTEEQAQAVQFITAFLADAEVPLPPAAIIDIGRIAGRGWAVIEANSVWGAGIYGCDPAQVLSALRQAVVARSTLSPAMEPWVRASIALEDDYQTPPPPNASGLVTLYRPVGQRELELIAATGHRAFPPRLPEQPIFYPVLNERYAAEIARGWNTNDAASGFVGYVTRFQVFADVVARYPVQVVGAAHHQELWVPAEELAAFNAAIVGEIVVVATYGFEDRT
jgi:hypothetical protein